MVDAFDDQIGYYSGWSPYGDFGLWTSVQGAFLTLDFVGSFRL